MIGSKRRVMENAMLKASVKAREVVMKHEMEFTSIQEIIQQRMMEMQNAQASQPQNQPAPDQPIQNP